MELLKKIGSALTAYPTSWDDYVGVGRWMIYRKLLVILCVVLFLTVAVMAAVIWWLLRPEPLIPEEIPVFHFTDGNLMRYSGEAVIVGDGETVLYRGHVQDGLRSGWGRAYSALGGHPLYEGGYSQDLYSGYGSLYSHTGPLLYKGFFQDGRYSGEGILYQEGKNDVPLYEGEFTNGEYSGYGVLYGGDAKCYEGAFANGRFEGEGVEYGPNGDIIYTGGFVRGMREGQGIESAGGIPVYEGAFRNGVYHGNGVLYTKSGTRERFEGEFFNGRPGLEGKIFNTRGQLLYDGPIYDGDVDCLQLLGLDISAWYQYIKEIPIVYYGKDFAAILYCELGIAGIGEYSLRRQEEPGGFQPKSILLGILLAEGPRYDDQIPTGGTASEWSHIAGYEAFMGAALADAAQGLQPGSYLGAEVTREDDYLYYVGGLPDYVPFQGEAIYSDHVYYINQTGTWEKGGSPDVVYCHKAVT